MKTLLSLIFIIAICAGYASGGQPIGFNHKKHVQMSLGCDLCHTTVRTGEPAGLPAIEVCLGCHVSPVTQSREEEKIREHARKGRGLEWVRLTSLPGHVYFSHRRHVVSGRVECKTCHGGMAETTTPPERPLMTLRMKDCLGCHEKRGAKTDCLYCHR